MSDISGDIEVCTKEIKSYKLSLAVLWCSLHVMCDSSSDAYLFSVVAVAILAAKDSASSADTDGFTAGM